MSEHLARYSLALAGLLPLTTTAPAQSIEPLVEVGSSVQGVGQVTEILDLAHHSPCSWLALVDTTAPADRDAVLLRNGAQLLRELQSLPGLPGPIDEFLAIDVDRHGNAACVVSLHAPSGRNTALLWNDTPLLVAGDTATPPAFGPGSVYREFRLLQVNDSEQLLVSCLVDDPGYQTLQALVRIAPGAAGGAPVQTAVAVEGAPLGPSGPPLDFLPPFQHFLAINDSGVAMYGARADTGNGGNDDFVMLGSTAIAEEGQPSPIVGLTWGSNTTPELDLNDAGDWAIVSVLEGASSTVRALVRNGELVIETGASLPGLPSGVTLQNFGTGPCELADDGRVLWSALGSGGGLPFPSRTLYIDLLPVVTTGITGVGSAVVTGLNSSAGGYHLADDGDSILFEAQLSDGRRGAYLWRAQDQQDCNGNGIEDACELLADPGLDQNGDGQLDSCDCGAENYCLSAINSSGQPAKLSILGSTGLAANDLSLTVHDAPPFQFGLYFYGRDRTFEILGDGALCVAGPQIRVGGVTLTDAAGSQIQPLDLSAAPFASGAGAVSALETWHFQFWFRDPNNGAAGFNFSDGLAVTFCP